MFEVLRLTCRYIKAAGTMVIFLILFEIIEISTCRLLSKQLSVFLFLPQPLELEPDFDNNKRGFISIYSGVTPRELGGTTEI